MRKRKYRRSTRMKNIHIRINFIFLIIFLIGILLIKSGMEIKKEDNVIFSYNIEKKDDYKVTLKPNDFYESNTLPSGRYYASKSINSFIIDFIYDFNASKETKLNYNYNITANLVGSVANNNDQGKEVWNRNFILLDNKQLEINSNQFNIDEQIDIDYEYYNNLARDYEEKYGLTINAILKIRFNIYLNANLTNMNLETKSIEDYIELDIPITNTVTNVEEKFEKSSTESIKDETSKLLFKQIIYYIIGGLFIIISIIQIMLWNRKGKNTLEKRYKDNIKRILKYYRELIVTVTNEPNLENLKVMNIKTLDDLIDVAEQSRCNIIHYETKVDIESKLYVIVNEYVYVYVITGEKIK